MWNCPAILINFWDQTILKEQYSNACIGFVVIFCTCEHILKVFFRFVENVQKCKQFPYDLCFVIVCDCWGIVGPKWSPPSPYPSTASMPKFPSGGKLYGNNTFVVLDVLWFYEKIIWGDSDFLILLAAIIFMITRL